VSQPWGFNGLLRRDVDQVDLTMLMAALVARSWPKNSVGILPEDLLQPDLDVERTRARLMLGNAKSVLEQFDTKQSEYFGNATGCELD
jgi:phosphatidylinositol glycan class N